MEIIISERMTSVPFFSLEDETKPTPLGEPTHSMSAQTFILDLHVDAKGKVAWTKLQRVLTSGDTVPSDAEAKVIYIYTYIHTYISCEWWAVFEYFPK